jgi:hypothetical protein
LEAGVSWLVRLYPRSWRRRYGRELESLVEEMPGRLGVAVDLIVGAAIAYRDVVGANRVLSAAGAWLHGLCVAVLLQAIVFVSLIMAAQGTASPSDFRVGPADLATYIPATHLRFGNLLSLGDVVWARQLAQTWLPEAALLVALVVALVGVMAAPRALRSLR